MPSLNQDNLNISLKTALRVFKTENVVPLVTHTNAETHYIWICTKDGPESV